MTDEEKALASFKKNYCPYCDNKMDCDISLVDCTSYDTMYRQSYLEGLAEIENYKMSENESLEIIAELKAENEKLKTCRNCNNEFTESCETCRRGLYDGKKDNWIIDKQL